MVRTFTGGISAGRSVIVLAAPVLLAACSLLVPFSEYDKETATTAPPPAGGACASDLRTDSRNCGACGHDCRGRACADSLCEPELVLPRQDEQPRFAYPKLALDETSVYVAFPGAESIVRLDKTSFLDLTLVANGLVGLEGIEAITRKDVYWQRQAAAGHGLGRAPKDGSPGSFLDLPRGVRSVRADATSLYYIDDELDDLYSVALALAGPTKKLASSISSDSVLATDGSFLYVVTSSGAQIRRLNKDGSEGLTLVEGQSRRTFLEVDDAHVYWASLTPPNTSISRVPKQGGPAELLSTGLTDLTSILALRGDIVYGVTFKALGGSVERGFDSYIWRLPKSGGTIVPLTAMQRLVDLSVDDEYVYWSNEDSISRVAR